MEKADKPKIAKPPHIPLQDFMVGSSHFAHIPDGADRVHCARCHSSFHVRDRGARAWLAAPCPNVGTDFDRPIHLPYELIHIGNRVVHHTHELMSFKGLVYCKRCGTRGTNQLRKLAVECEPPTQYGKQSLAKLAGGKLPPNMTRWPAG